MRVFATILGVLMLGLGAAPAALAQGRAEVQLEARTDTGGAAPACLLTARLRNAGERRITVFAADVEAVDARSGAVLRLNQAQIAFGGVEPGATQERATTAVAGARCDQVRLRFTRVTCSPRCGEATWRTDGLARFEAPAR